MQIRDKDVDEPRHEDMDQPGTQPDPNAQVPPEMDPNAQVPPELDPNAQVQPQGNANDQVAPAADEDVALVCARVIRGRGIGHL